MAGLAPNIQQRQQLVQNNLARAPGAPQNVGGVGTKTPGGAAPGQPLTHTATPQQQAAAQTVPGGAQQQPNPAPATQPSSNPYQPTYAPQAPVGQATMSAAQTSLTPEQMAQLSPDATIAQILKGFQPQANLATSNLNNTLAASGIVGGGAQQAQNLLQSNLASALAPTLANAIQTSQGNTLGAEEFGLQGGLNQSLANAGAANQMTGQNVQNAMGVNLANMNAANQAKSQLAQALQSGWQMPFEAFAQLQTGGLGSAGSLAGQEAQNFAVPQQQSGGLLGFLGL